MYKTITKEGGALLIGELPEQPGGHATIHVIMVPEGLRRRGLGTKMIQDFEAIARQSRASRINTMFTNQDTNASTRPGLIALFTKNKYRLDVDLGLGPLYFKQLEGRKRHK